MPNQDQATVEACSALWQIAIPLIESGVIRKAAVEPFAQRMAEATAAKARGAIMNDLFKMLTDHLQVARRRLLVRHPGRN